MYPYIHIITNKIKKKMKARTLVHYEMIKVTLMFDK